MEHEAFRNCFLSLEVSRCISTGFLYARTMSGALQVNVDYGMGKWEGKWK